MNKRIPVKTHPTPPASSAGLFTRTLMHWHVQDNRRMMPWKGERDPYRIWLSEIILQQTRVEQGWAYYERFIRAYPDVRSLASAVDSDVFKLWEGLGYYARCRNLLKAARQVVTDHGGHFPADHTSILSLQGVGPYTAAAVSSFAFGLPHAVVDGNVLRVLARFFGIRESIDEAPIKRMLEAWAQALLYLEDPAAYNQAIMDFGATVCKPAAPKCIECPMSEGCLAFREGLQDQLPARTPKAARRLRWMDYVIPVAGTAIPLRERTSKDVWRNLFEPFMIESPEQKTASWLIAHPMVTALNGGAPPISYQVSEPYVQLLTHQQITGRFLIFRPHKPPQLTEGYAWVDISALNDIAFPRHIRQFLDEDPFLFTHL
jgi:A/G-specific adenine glycosylase